MGSTARLTVPVRTDIRPDSKLEFIGGYIEVEVPSFDADEVPVVAEYSEGEETWGYRAIGGQLYAPLGGSTPRPFDYISPTPLPPGEYQIKNYKPERFAIHHFDTFPYSASYKYNFINWTGGEMTILEHPEQHPDFVVSADRVRKSMLDVVMVDGSAWSRTMGPTVYAASNKDEGPRGGSLQSYPRSPYEKWFSPDTARTFSAFDAEMVLEAFRMEHPFYRNEAGSTRILSEDGWDRAELSKEFGRQALISMAERILESIKDFRVGALSEEVVEFYGALRAEKEAAATYDDRSSEILSDLIGDGVACMAPHASEARMRQWRAALDVCARTAGYEVLKGLRI